MVLYGGYMPIVTFSVPQDIYEKIQSNVLANESENLAAKRLLLAVLGIESPGAIPSDFGDRLADLSERMAAIEGDLSDVTSGFSADDLGRLTQLLIEDIKKELPPPSPDIGDRLESLERQVTDLWEESKDFSALSRSEERLDKIEASLEELGEKIPDKGWNYVITTLADRVKVLEKLTKPETAIMVQKQPLPPAPKTEITRTHEEAANDWEKSLATVKRWAKDPDKWPEGWLWDGDRNFWVKEV